MQYHGAMAGAFLDAIEPTTAAALLADSVQRTLPRNRFLFHEGDGPLDAFVIDTGLLKLFKTSLDGSQALLALRGPGAIVGELGAIDGRPRMLSAVAAVDSQITVIPGDRLVGLIRDRPELAMTMLSNQSILLRQTAFHILALASADAVALVARRLLQLVDNPAYAAVRSERAGTTVIDMPLSQQEVAAWAGVSLRSAAAVLKQLRDDSIVSTSRLQLEVHDRDELERRAGSLVAFTSS
jgi:CRP/FNR family cyclic AMP-dependent transcriptional regulator